MMLLYGLNIELHTVLQSMNWIFEFSLGLHEIKTNWLDIIAFHQSSTEYSQG
jgi:hypothetical protein